MIYAYASKDQMKLWKITDKPAKGESPSSRHTVYFQITEDDKRGMAAFLYASDGYTAIKRGVELEGGAEVTRISIPRQAIESAEKTMVKGDRAYFEPGRIVVSEVSINEWDEEELKQKAVVPYVEQLELAAPEWDHLSKYSKEGTERRSIKVNVSILEAALKQFRHYNHGVYMNLSIGGPEDPILLDAFADVECQEIFGIAMPLRPDPNENVLNRGAESKEEEPEK